ncbi:MAG: hypothetical protein ABI597_01785 [Gammaproteobacteria bacterium]
MKNILLAAGILVALASTPYSFAQPETSDKILGSLTNWLSKDSTDLVSIQNGTGIHLVITITVNRGGAGVSVKNCGTTTHIDAGSSTICSTNDAINPVTLSSESGTSPATGTYLVKTVTAP